MFSCGFSAKPEMRFSIAANLSEKDDIDANINAIIFSCDGPVDAVLLLGVFCMACSLLLSFFSSLSTFKRSHLFLTASHAPCHTFYRLTYPCSVSSQE